MILNQGSRRNCGVWAVMAILQHAGVQFDISKFSEEKAPYINQLENLFIASGLVNKFIKIPTPRLVDLWLKKGEYLLVATHRGDFTMYDNKDGVLEFDEKSQHYFVIIEDCGDRWKCQNSWGAEWDGDGCFYMKKSDFKYLIIPRRVVLFKKSV